MNDHAKIASPIPTARSDERWAVRYLVFAPAATLMLTMPSDRPLVWETAVVVAVILCAIAAWRPLAAIATGCLTGFLAVLSPVPESGDATMDAVMHALSPIGFMRGVLLALVAYMVWDVVSRLVRAAIRRTS